MNKPVLKLLLAAALSLAWTLPARAEPDAGDDLAQRAAERAMRTQERAQAHAEAAAARAEAARARAEAEAERLSADAQRIAAHAQEQAARALEEHDYSALTALNTLPLAAISPEMFARKHHRETTVDSGDGNGGGGDRPVNERRPLNADGRVYVNDVAGTVVVTAWDRNEVVATGTLGYGVDRLDVSGDASDLSFTVKLPKHSHNVGESDLRLLVPQGARVEVEAVSADVSVQGTRGPLKITTVSGDVGADVQSPEVAVQTVSGDLILRAPSKSTRANTVSGDLHLSGLQGMLAAESVSGNLSVSGSRFSELRLKSISGDMGLEASFAPQARVTGETLSGNITLRVPPDVSGTALVKSFSGEAQCDMQHTSVSAANKGKRREFVFGDGHGVSLELSTFSGDVRIDGLPGSGVVPPAPPAPPMPPAPPAPPARR
jgi:hypothetical protein